jgi:hypothetical protein
MKKNIIIFFVLVLLGNITSCQDSVLKLKLSLSSTNIALGEPLYFTVTLCNEGIGSIQLAPGETEGDFSCNIFTRCPDGTIIQGVGAGIAGSRACPAMPIEIVPPKECRKTAVVPFVSCLTTFNKAGKYELWMEYETSTGIILSQLKRPILEEPVKYWKGRLKSDVCSLEVVEPTGLDRTAYERWLKPYALREKSLANFYTGNSDTMLQDGTHQLKDVRLLEEIMRDYPTSTYAGYELAKCAKENLHDYVNMSHEDIDEVLGVRGLIPEKQDAYRKERKKHFQDKLNLLQAFIAVHPDFVKADMIRSGISFYLLVLGRQNEAMEEIKILSKMEGRWAEGARKALSMTCHEDEKVKTKTGEKSK